MPSSFCIDATSSSICSNMPVSSSLDFSPVLRLLRQAEIRLTDDMSPTCRPRFLLHDAFKRNHYLLLPFRCPKSHRTGSVTHHSLRLWHSYRLLRFFVLNCFPSVPTPTRNIPESAKATPRMTAVVICSSVAIRPLHGTQNQPTSN